MAPAAKQVVVELLSEGLAQQVEGKGVDAGVAERQNSGTNAADQVRHGGVHLFIVVGAVQVDDVTGEPAYSKEAHKYQHRLCKSFPGFHL